MKAHERGEIDQLFQQLRYANDEAEIHEIELNILALWFRGDHPMVNMLMQTGIRQMREEAYDKAISTFGEMIRLEPDHAESWNKRGVCHYLRGEYRKALEDLTHTLRLEPRHFAAMAGIANIYRELKLDELHLRMLLRIQRLNPNSSKLKEQISRMRHS